MELVADIPAVGARLLDHPGAAMFFRMRGFQHNMGFPLIQNVVRFTSKGSPFPNDVQLQPGSFMPFPSGLVLPLVSLMCSVGKPRSHGSIRFLDTSPRRRPFIESDVMIDAADRQVAMEAMRMALLASETSSMRELATLFWPRPDVLTDPVRFEQFLPRISGSGYHPSGTVPMGKDGDPRGAVTERGRVRPVEGLWVADASLMPTIPSANTNFPTLMMGERFGEWFRDRVEG